MMNRSKVRELRDAVDEVQDGLTLNAWKLSKIESDGVHLQCVNSSDFMVGKQTNFNGPVTIINYADGEERENPLQRHAKAGEMVIKERIMSPGVASSIEKFVKKKAEEELKMLQQPKDKGDHLPWAKILCRRSFLKIPVIMWGLLLFIVFAGIITLGIELSDVDYSESADTIPGETRNYTFYRRKNWGAAEEVSGVRMKLPVPYVIISSTDSKPCEGLLQCGQILRAQQSVQMKKSQADIYPNFFVSGDGSVYEGRGWHKRNAFLGFANNRNLEISFIGDFVASNKPTENQTGAAKALIEYALKEKALVDDYRLCPATAKGIRLLEENPTLGKNLYEVIETWKNFEPHPYKEFFPTKAPYGA